MIYIYTNLEISNNFSKGPNGLLKWIISILNEERINFKIYRNAKDFNKFKNKKIFIYPSSLTKDLLESTKNKNKILALGPDSNSLEILNLLSYRLSLIKFLFRIRFIQNIFILFFDKENIEQDNKLILVGKKDANLIFRFKKNIKILSHPFLSSLDNKKPLKPINTNVLDFVIIGKIKGMPVGFRNLDNTILKYIKPLLTKYNNKLYIFKSSGFNLINNSKNIVLIDKNEVLHKQFFRNKIVLNLAICGAGTANRSLSSLFDGSYLFSTKFGLRNINLKKFSDQIGFSSYSPFSSLFYKDLEYFLNINKTSDNRNFIDEQNNQSKEQILDTLKNW